MDQLVIRTHNLGLNYLAGLVVSPSR